LINISLLKDSKRLRHWLDEFGLDHPLVIAGPCSAETEEQLLTTAHKLNETPATVLRAGIWKPRSRPGFFEGVGEKGLKWLNTAKEETGLLTATEVASARHVELAFKHNIDILWIGARTTVSPFMVQELAEALKGTDKIVLVKNPVNPDLALWLGAVERFHKYEIRNLGVIHRGFPSYEKTKYRNNPEWQITIDLQNSFPNLPLLLDPSHIAGNRSLIFDLCQTALDLNYDGFMIETHLDPDNAWSDASQQITPKTLKKITGRLKVRDSDSDVIEYQKLLNTMRSEIELVDHKILEIMAKRMKIVDQIGKLKKDNNVAILQTKRWNAILSKMIREGDENNLSEDFILDLFKAIHQESIKHQKKIIDN
jgi:chorismate mutase